MSLSEEVGQGAQPDFWAVDFGDGQVITGNGAPPATVTTADGAGFGSDPLVTIADDHGYGLDLGP